MSGDCSRVEDDSSSEKNDFGDRGVCGMAEADDMTEEMGGDSGRSQKTRKLQSLQVF